MKLLNSQSTLRKDEASPSTADSCGPSASRRVAFWTFVAVELVVFSGLLWNFHGRWFIADEWDFLALRTAGNLHSLFAPYNEHWSTLPILYYRLLWNLFGIRTYYPYLVSILTLHIAIASMLRLVMVRAHVAPWLATVSAVAFSLYGAGYSDISYAFNIGFDGSVFFGLLFLIAVDHSDGVRRRDACGLLAGLASLMCSGIGIAMVMVVVMAVFLRHGWRRALLMTVPLAGAYLIWFAVIGHSTSASHSSTSAIFKFVLFGLAFTFTSLGHSPVVGAALAGLLLVGIIVAVRTTSVTNLRARYSAPAAMLVGAATLLTITGFERADPSLPSVDTYAASRYLYVAAALVIPALAVAATQLVSISKALWPVVLVVLVAGIPGNVLVMHRSNYLHTLDSYRQFILAIPRLPVATGLPRMTFPDPLYDRAMTLGWLLDGVRDGRIPPPSPPLSPGERAYYTLRLALQPTAPSSSGACHIVDLPATIQVQAGIRLTSVAPVSIAAIYGSNQRSTSILVPASTHISAWPMELSITPTKPRQAITVCR